MPEHQDTVNPDLGAPGGEPSRAPSDETATASEKDFMPSAEEILRRVELQAAEHYDAWLRAKADAENTRRRAQEDIAKAHKFAVENFSSEMLAVRDSLEAALAVQNATAESMKSGVEITLRQLASVFERFSVREVHPVGEKFDPHRHQAMSAVESDAPPNTVVQVFQKGYLLHDRVLRPALVAVAKARET